MGHTDVNTQQGVDVLFSSLSVPHLGRNVSKKKTELVKFLTNCFVHKCRTIWLATTILLKGAMQCAIGMTVIFFVIKLVPCLNVGSDVLHTSAVESFQVHSARNIDVLGES